MQLLLAACLLALSFSAAVGYFQISDEKRLTKNLVNNYERIGRLGRPVLYANQTWNVSFSLSLLKITDIDYREQTVEAIVWTTMMWKDVNLKWNAADFGNVNSVRLPAGDIYVPDITLYTSASKPESLNPQDMVVVQSDGSVIYVPPVKQRFTCDIPAPRGSTEFTCSLKFGSWTYDGLKLNLTTHDKQADVSLFKPNPGWDVVRSTTERHVVRYDCCPEPYIDLTYNLTVRMTGPSDDKLRVKSNKLNLD